LYDVIVVGAGAVGSYVARRLAQLGHRVAVFEAKEAVGSKVCCSGIVSRECYDLFHPGEDKETVVREASSARFFAPSGQSLTLAKDTVQAYIVDRAAFDIAQAKKAQEAGADYFVQSRVTDVLAERKWCQVSVSRLGRRQRFQARAVVLACGFGSTLPEELGMGKISDFLFGAQTEVKTEINEVEVYFDQELAPGGFAWLVPTSAGRGLAGVISRQRASPLLKGFLSKLTADRSLDGNNLEIRQEAIPLGVLPRTYGKRVLVVGEAAGQVKPTTGGGIYFGLLCAELATKTLHQALLADDLSSKRLSRYQREWRSEIAADLRLDYLARRLYTRLNNEQIEQVFDLMISSRIPEELLQWKEFSFDWHGRLIHRLLRQPRLLAVVVTPRLRMVKWWGKNLAINPKL
jgi:digeranylgeranylglycerophospholipid reductase